MITEINSENERVDGSFEILQTHNTFDPARNAFLTHPLGSLIMKNALPAVASMLFMAFYQIVDGILVGQRLGPEALASVNVLYPVLAVFVALAVMIGVGGNSRIAVLLGGGETVNACRVLGLITALGVALGVGGSLFVILAFSNILSVLGTSGILGELAGQYLNTLYPFFTSMILIFILEQAVRNDGRANLATVIMASMALLNILLDYLFLFPLNMGIAGAALATGISQSLGAIFFLGYFLVKTIHRRPGLCFGIPGGGLSVLQAIAANGSSEFFNSLALGLTTFLFNRIILSYVGAIGVAAFALVQYMLMVGLMVITGMSIGTQPILSYNYGAGLSHRVRGTLNRLLAASIVLGIIFFTVLQWQTEALALLFIPDNPETLSITLRVGNIVSWSIIFMPVGIVGSVFFTSLEKAGNSLVIAVSRGLVFTVIGLATFPLLWGESGIWVTPVFAEGVTALVAAFLMYRYTINAPSSRATLCCEGN